VTCGYQDNLGYGFNTALGVKVAHPDKAVISVSGDGGSCSACRNWRLPCTGINLVTIVFNNSGYGNVRRDQQDKYHGRLLESTCAIPTSSSWQKVLGRSGCAPAVPRLGPVLQRALAAEVPVLVEVACPPGGETPWSFLPPRPADCAARGAKVAHAAAGVAPEFGSRFPRCCTRWYPKRHAAGEQSKRGL
jgi:acetolactate synthase-1/2/3 large subunit